MNGFGPGFLLDAFQKYIPEYEYTYYQPKSWRYDFINNYLHLKKMRLQGKLAEFDVLHCSIWSNMTNMVPKKNQIGISHWHGFSLGVNSKNALSDSNRFNQLLGKTLNPLVEKRIREAIQKYTLIYAAIPNVLAELKKIREDAVWLPNPINTELFSPHGDKVKMEGEPAIFFPTRFHKMKTPEIGMKIFDDIKKSFPQAKLHLIRYPNRFSQYGYYREVLHKYKSDIVWHDFIPREQLPSLYRSFDLVIGSFGKGLLNLVELEAMACKTAVVSYDNYEFIKKDISELPGLALKLLESKTFKNSYVQNAFEYVCEVHSQEKVAQQHRKNLSKNY